jgi:hypothetical protein
MEDTWIGTGKPEWASHIERVHGKLHAPFFPSHPPASGRDGIWCIICDKKFNKRNGLIWHCRETHAKKEKLFDEPYQCSECCALVHGGGEAWIEHIRDFHGESVIQALPAHPSDTSDLKRKHTYDDSGEPTIEATSITDDCCKRPKTCSLNGDFDSHSSSGDRYCLDMVKDRMAVKDATI